VRTCTFIEAARRHAQLAGWREEDIHFELFAAPVMANAETPSAAQAHAEERVFELVLHRSGLRCEVQPGQSIVAAAAQVGVIIGTSCGEGFCGSCERCAGRPALHRDSVLSDAERAGGRRILPCVSRCAGTTGPGSVIG
jgi:vanillate O-demethylase ferredoxin subunit